MFLRFEIGPARAEALRPLEVRLSNHVVITKSA
jgi:hypothetical protein